MRSRREVAVIRWIVVVLALLLMGAGLTYYFIKIHPEVMYRRQKVTKMPFNSNDTFAAHNGGALFVKEGNLSFVGREGGVVWTQETLAGGKLIADGGVPCVYTDNKVSAYAWDTGTPLFSKTFVGQQVDLVRSSKTHVAVAIKNSDGSRGVEVYTAAGGKVDDLQFAGQTVLDMGFYNAGGNATLWVSSIKQGSPQADVRILTYNPQKNAISTSVTVPGQLCYRTVFGDKMLYAVGTNHLLGYNYNSDLAFKMVIYGWRLLDSQSNGLPMVFTPSGPGSHIGQAMKIITSNQTQQMVALPAGTLDVVVGDKAILVITASTIYSYDHTGKLKRDYPLSIDLPIQSVQVAPDKKTFFAIAQEAVYLLSLP